MNDNELLEKNGWIVECESPFEIRMSDSIATGYAVTEIINNIYRSEKLYKLKIITESYKEGIIDENKFKSEILKEFEDE